MKPIYKPKGAAGEYGDYAINIYTGCPHRCTYCYVPAVLHMTREQFHSRVEPRAGIAEAVRKQIEREQIYEKQIFLCFACDPYPFGYDASVTREVIQVIKESGNHIKILTKNGYDAINDFDLLNENDWYGVTLTGSEPFDEPDASKDNDRKLSLRIAKENGISTWISFEPVLNADYVLETIVRLKDRCDFVAIGKLNYHKSSINWAEFGRKAEEICQRNGVDYYIKSSLRKEMANGEL